MRAEQPIEKRRENDELRVDKEEYIWADAPPVTSARSAPGTEPGGDAARYTALQTR